MQIKMFHRSVKIFETVVQAPKSSNDTINYRYVYKPRPTSLSIFQVDTHK